VTNEPPDRTDLVRNPSRTIRLKRLRKPHGSEDIDCYRSDESVNVRRSWKRSWKDKGPLAPTCHSGFSKVVDESQGVLIGSSIQSGWTKG
jgi:hypothetical protein